MQTLSSASVQDSGATQQQAVPQKLERFLHLFPCQCQRPLPLQPCPLPWQRPLLYWCCWLHPLPSWKPLLLPTQQTPIQSQAKIIQSCLHAFFVFSVAPFQDNLFLIFDSEHSIFLLTSLPINVTRMRADILGGTPGGLPDTAASFLQHETMEAEVSVELYS